MRSALLQLKLARTWGVAAAAGSTIASPASSPSPPSGPPPLGAPRGVRHRRRVVALRHAAGGGAARAFRAFVRRSDDRRLERTAGSDLGLRMLFAAMARAYEPAHADGFSGELQFDLRRADGCVSGWAVALDARRAAVRPGAATSPALTLTLTVADLLRVAAGEVDAGAALLAGRLDLTGDFALAQRLGVMFGRPAAL
jgi:putative sterol carrier protein